jgi:hypothetical protein
VGTKPSIGERAASIGHVVTVDHAHKRFRLVCACGWSSSLGWSRKLVFVRLGDHLIAVVRETEKNGKRDTPLMHESVGEVA